VQSLPVSKLPFNSPLAVVTKCVELTYSEIFFETTKKHSSFVHNIRAILDRVTAEFLTRKQTGNDGLHRTEQLKSSMVAGSFEQKPFSEYV
jgi:hypothetical protein